MAPMARVSPPLFWTAQPGATARPGPTGGNPRPPSKKTSTARFRRTNRDGAAILQEGEVSPGLASRSAERNIMAIRRRRVDKSEESTPAKRVKKKVADLFQTAPAQRAKEPSADQLPALRGGTAKILESVFSLEQLEGQALSDIHDELVEALSLREALTPGNLQARLNMAESNALKAHQLFITAKVDYERFELEMEPIMEKMRDAAMKELQAEKDAKQRSKAITEADIRGRASVMFPDEWAEACIRKIRASSMMDQLARLSKLWEQRCFSLSTLLNTGKRS